MSKRKYSKEKRKKVNAFGVRHVDKDLPRTAVLMRQYTIGYMINKRLSADRLFYVELFV